ncbi:hypothetical protein Scep_012012 [Stephania cephalantha]|uniref:Uncharacterized protein n=1 Tax=Stephania cephalantha TaxID=152367 RepID=A0AAP0JEF5_9MAGN
MPFKNLIFCLEVSPRTNTHECVPARFWKGSPLGMDTSQLKGCAFWDLWLYIIKMLENSVVEEGIWTWFAMGLWQLWKRRYKFVFHCILTPLEDTLNLTSARCLEWRGKSPNPSPYQPDYNHRIASVFFWGNI